MGGDYTRFTFKPERDHAGVLMQQGRVQLDADWNEFVEMVDRRLLAETLDLSGRRCGVPRTTPDGFRIERNGDGRLTIGRGRIYVDGILTENHGAGDPEVEPGWREIRGQDPVPYRDQPYLRPPIPPTEPDGDGPHLVYLDVWRREVTAVEGPEIVERALGVDTTTRLQTAWAVRCIPDIDREREVGCGMDLSRLDAWVEETRPSGARLTTGEPEVPEQPDPCLISPTGGYRGIENRLYRVEIHDDGSEAGLPISFKWSRDNGSVAATISSIADAETKPRLVVNRLGRDAVLRFRDLDWVELTDDRRETEGRPGIMARVERSDEATSTITLVDPLDPATETLEMGRNPRVRRWDQTGDRVNARGVIPLEPLPTELELEDGVMVRFTLEGADPPRVGDYWVFAARAADGSMEELDEALPRGVRHHYCPLAILRGDEIEDCRDLFPEEQEDCECTVCVTPESHEDGSLTIQQAVDRVSERGGKICLAPGVYEVAKAVRIRGARGIQIAGKGSRSVIVHEGRGPGIDINESYDVTIERLAIASASSGLGQRLLEGTGIEAGARRRRRRKRKRPRAPEIGVMIRKTVGITIEHCVLAQSESLFRRPAPLAEEFDEEDGRSRSRSRRSRARDDRFDEAGSIGIALAGMAIETRIRDNVVFAETGVGLLAVGKTPAPPRPEGELADYVAPGRADDAEETWGVGGMELHRAEEGEARMAAEYAIRAEGSGERATSRAEGEVEELVTVLEEPSGIRELPRYLLTVRLLIEDNVFVGLSAGVDLVSFGGGLRTTSLVVHAGETRVAGNSIYRARVGIALMGIVPGAGLLTKRRDGLSSSSAGRLMEGAAGIGGMDGSRVEITKNSCSLGVAGILVGCDGARIEDNHVTGVRGFPSSGIMLFASFYGGSASSYGYTAELRETVTAYYRTLMGVQVRGNVISGFRDFGIDTVYAPVLVQAEITENRIDDCSTGGIQVTQAHGVEISDNQIRDVGSESDDIAAGIALGSDSDVARITGNVVSGVGQDAEGLASCTGIGVGVASSLRIYSNDVSSVATPPDTLTVVSGIRVAQGPEQLEIVENTVRGPDAGNTGADCTAVRLGNHILSASDEADIRRRAEGAAAMTIRPTRPETTQLATLLVRGNRLEAAGYSPCLILGIEFHGSCIVAENQCFLDTGSPIQANDVVLSLGAFTHLIMNSNHVHGNAREGIVILINPGSPFTFLGNVVSGVINVNVGPLGAPWDALNVSY